MHMSTLYILRSQSSARKIERSILVLNLDSVENNFETSLTGQKIFPLVNLKDRNACHVHAGIYIDRS